MNIENEHKKVYKKLIQEVEEVDIKMILKNCCKKLIDRK